MKKIPEEHGCDYMLPLEVQQPEYSGVHTPLDSCSRSTDILAKGAASSRVVPRVLRLGPIATMGGAGWRTASWMASGDGYLLEWEKSFYAAKSRGTIWKSRRGKGQFYRR